MRKNSLRWHYEVKQSKFEHAIPEFPFNQWPTFWDTLQLKGKFHILTCTGIVESNESGR